MGEFILRLLAAIVIGLFIAAPVSVVVFLYGLACGRSLSQALSAAAEVAANIVCEVTLQA